MRSGFHGNTPAWHGPLPHPAHKPPSPRTRQAAFHEQNGIKGVFSGSVFRLCTATRGVQKDIFTEGRKGHKDPSCPAVPLKRSAAPIRFSKTGLNKRKRRKQRTAGFSVIQFSDCARRSRTRPPRLPARHSQLRYLDEPSGVAITEDGRPIAREFQPCLKYVFPPPPGRSVPRLAAARSQGKSPALCFLRFLLLIPCLLLNAPGCQRRP